MHTHPYADCFTAWCDNFYSFIQDEIKGRYSPKKVEYCDDCENVACKTCVISPGNDTGIFYRSEYPSDYTLCLNCVTPIYEDNFIKIIENECDGIFSMDIMAIISDWSCLSSKPFTM